jgi:glycosyltransferase involved in cell wall biosynthesis
MPYIAAYIKMKIGIYKDTFVNNRGADIAVKNLAAGLEERGHAVTLFDKSQFAEKVRGDYDILISTGTNEILDLAQVDGLPPIIQQFHTDPKYPFRHWIKRWKRNRAIKAALKKAAAFQVLRDEHIETLQKLIGVSREKITIIGNWSSFEGCTKVFSEGDVILCPGAINSDKNQSLLVEAFASIANEFPDWQVHIYGCGKARDEAALSKRIKAKGMADRILIKGYADLSEPYARCAFVAFPSKTEGFGMVILDAAMFKKPTLMIHDWIGCGEVAEPSDFASALRRLMIDAGYRCALGDKAYKYCSMHYSRSKILDAWESLFSALVSCFMIDKT